MKPLLVSALAAAIAMGAPRADAGDPPSKVLAQFGLTGVWSVACDQPAGPHNPRYSYEPRPDGQVDAVGDFGEDGPSRSTVRDAFIDQDRKLHATAYATFDNLPKAMRDAMEKSGTRPSMTSKNVFSIGADGSLTIEDTIVDVQGLAAATHTVSGGYAVNQATQTPGPKVPARFKCR